MSRPLRVVHVITTLTTGGAERQLELLVARSHQRTSTLALYEGGPVADSMRAAGAGVDVVGMAGWRKALAIPRLALRLRRIRPDVVHVHLLSAQLWGIPAARLAGVPVVVSSEHSLMESTVEGRPHRWWLRTLYRLLERLSTHTVAVSATTADRLAQWGVPAERVTVIDNGIDFAGLAHDPAARAQVRAELGLGDAVVLGVVGRLDPVKRVDEVLAACAGLLHRPGHVLLVVGTGPLRPRLEEQARALGIAERVRFLGARGDVPRLLSAMDLVVSASRDETFGMAVVEAVGSGLPVVYAQCPALEELADRPAGAHQVGPAGLAVAVEQAVAAGLHRQPVPGALLDRYDAPGTAGRVDALYEQLSAP